MLISTVGAQFTLLPAVNKGSSFPTASLTYVVIYVLDVGHSHWVIESFRASFNLPFSCSQGCQIYFVKCGLPFIFLLGDSVDKWEL